MLLLFCKKEQISETKQVHPQNMQDTPYAMPTLPKALDPTTFSGFIILSIAHKHIPELDKNQYMLTRILVCAKNEVTVVSPIRPEML